MRSREDLEKHYGECVELVTPSGYNITLRQQNGDDDDILSLHKDSADGSSINKFIASIVVATDFNEKGRLTLSDMLSMKIRDKYFIVISSRIFSIGQILKFEYHWDDLDKPTEYEEDLGLYIWDYGKEFPTIDNEDYFESRITPQVKGKEIHREFDLSSGKHVRYTYMDGKGEKFLLEKSLEEQSKNLELIARDLHEKVGEAWVKVQNFKNYTPADMRELRNDILVKNDPILSVATELTHPINSEVKVYYPIMSTNDFFYPREV